MDKAWRWGLVVARGERSARRNSSIAHCSHASSRGTSRAASLAGASSFSTHVENREVWDGLSCAESRHVLAGVSRGSLVLKQLEIGDVLARRASVDFGHVLAGAPPREPGVGTGRYRRCLGSACECRNRAGFGRRPSREGVVFDLLLESRRASRRGGRFHHVSETEASVAGRSSIWALSSNIPNPNSRTTLLQTGPSTRADVPCFTSNSPDTGHEQATQTQPMFAKPTKPKKPMKSEFGSQSHSRESEGRVATGTHQASTTQIGGLIRARQKQGYEGRLHPPHPCAPYPNPHYPRVIPDPRREKCLSSLPPNR